MAHLLCHFSAKTTMSKIGKTKKRFDMNQKDQWTSHPALFPALSHSYLAFEIFSSSVNYAKLRVLQMGLYMEIQTSHGKQFIPALWILTNLASFVSFYKVIFLISEAYRFLSVL